MAKQRKITFQQKYKKGVILDNMSQLEAIVKEATEVQLLSQQTYDDNTESMTVTIIFNKAT